LETFALLRLQLVASCISITTYLGKNAATQNTSKWMHKRTNPMTGMDLISAEQPKTSVMKVRTLQELIECPNLKGSGQNKTQDVSGLGSTRDATCPTAKMSFSLADRSSRSVQDLAAWPTV